MFLNALVLAAVAILGSRHHHPAPHREPHPAEVVNARELAIDPIASADSKVPPTTAPLLDRRPGTVAARPRAEVPDFRSAVARQLESLPICRRSGGPDGPGLAQVVYLPNGTARVSLSRNYASSPVGACVARRFANAAVPFDGEPVGLELRFEL